MLDAATTIRTALQLYGAVNRHDYELADALREREGDRLRFHRATLPVQPTAYIPAPLILARSARQREQAALIKVRNAPRWTVRNALRLFGERYRTAVGMAATAVGIQSPGAVSAKNRETLRLALRFYGDLWRVTKAPVLAS